MTATTIDSVLPNNAYITSFVEYDTTIFASTFGGGVIGSKNYFASWRVFNDNLTNLYVTDLAVKNGCLFAGTQGSGIWRRHISEMVSVLPHNQRAIPLPSGIRSIVSSFSRHGIMINYSIQSHCSVHLGIFTISGKKVAAIDQGERAPGEFSVRFDSGRIPAGMYVCRFEAGNFRTSSRFIMMK